MTRAARHQSDMLRAALGAATLAGSTVAARAGDPGVVEVNLFRLINQLPGFLAAPLLGVMQLGSLGAVAVVAAVALAGRRRRLARLLAVGGAAAWAAARLLQAVVGQQPPDAVLNGVVLHGSGGPGLAFPATHVAVVAAMATVAGPYLSRPARRLGWLVVAVVAVARIYTGAHFPVDVVGGAALGWTVGALVHLVVGAPRGRISAATVEAALAPHLGPVLVEAGVSSEPGIVAYRARGPGGEPLLAKVVGRDQPENDWLYRLWRLAAFREPEDEDAIGSPAHRVEHEAYLGLRAREEGVRVPPLVLTSALGAGEHLLVRSWVEGTTVSDLEPAELCRPLLDAIWSEVAALHRAGVAHGSLRADHVVIDAGRRAWLVELGLGRAGAGAQDRARDVAELAASLAGRAQPAELVAAATAALGPAAVAQAVAFLQPLSLSAATRRRLGAGSPALAALADEAARSTGVAPPATEVPYRVALRNLLPWLGLGFAVFVALPQVGQAGATLEALRRARWVWLPAVAAASAFTYLMAALAVMGASGARLALGRTWAVQVAAAFTNRLAPAGLGGMSTNVRYLLAAGVHRAAAATTVGLTSAAGFVVHALGLIVVVPLLGSGGRAHLPSPPDLPDRWPALVGVAGALAAAGLLRWGRRLAGHLGPALRTARSNLAMVATRPGRAVALFGGSAGVTAGYAAALTASLKAFGGGLPVTRVVAAYLGASALAAAAPTPGGLGALEAALVAALTKLGGATGPSVAAVLLYRLVTYWAPVVPGLVLFRRLRRRGVL